MAMGMKEINKREVENSKNKQPSPKELLIKLERSITKKNTLPSIIFMAGEERFYIDTADEMFARHFIDREEWDLNRSILYGSDLSVEQLLLNIQSVSIVGGERLFLVREAQCIKKLDLICENASLIPQDTTLVLCYVGDIEQHKSLLEKFTEVGAFILLSPRMKNKRDASTLISYVCNKENMSLAPDAIDTLMELVGYNGTIISSELRKLSIVASSLPNRNISKQVVMQYVAQSREYSPYELLDALINKNRKRAYEIALHMGKHEKQYPLPLILSALSPFFVNLLAVLYQPATISLDGISALLSLRNRYAAQNYLTGKNYFSAKQVFDIIHELRMAEARFKGCEEGEYTPQGILTDLVTFILA